MLKALFLLVLLYLSFFLKGQSQINSIIGDSSWYYYSGSWPNGDEDENQRITVHLKYVLKRLKSKNNPASSNRQRILSILEEYIKQQKFPKNTQYTERRPCFIDDNGTICAVGYLI
ncbi:MAG: hypothetical protein MRY83_04515 [Flavobacteriales bacterium]|nr:hypothetical protein [Flavobacteriales bacterium]